MLAGENGVWGLLAQEDLSSYALAGMKGLADPRSTPHCLLKLPAGSNIPYPRCLLLVTTQMPQGHKANVASL